MTVTLLPRALSAAVASVQLEGASETPYASVRTQSGCLSMGKLARYHTDMVQSPDPGPDSLSRCRDRVTVAESTLGSRGEHAGRGRVRDSKRVTAGGERVFEHQEAHPAPPGGGTPTHSLSRHAQPMPWSCNGRREHSRQPWRAHWPRARSDSKRVTAGGERVFEHGNARAEPYVHGPVA